MKAKEFLTIANEAAEKGGLPKMEPGKLKQIMQNGSSIHFSDKFKANGSPVKGNNPEKPENS